jgi:hypothetical protein
LLSLKLNSARTGVLLSAEKSCCGELFGTREFSKENKLIVVKIF